MPALPRTSVPQSVMSSPLKQDPPAGDLVLGAAEQGGGEGRLARAVGAHEGVDLAGADVRSTPRRISRRPSVRAGSQVLDLEERAAGHGASVLALRR